MFSHRTVITKDVVGVCSFCTPSPPTAAKRTKTTPFPIPEKVIELGGGGPPHTGPQSATGEKPNCTSTTPSAGETSCNTQRNPYCGGAGSITFVSSPRCSATGTAFSSTTGIGASGLQESSIPPQLTTTVKRKHLIPLCAHATTEYSAHQQKTLYPHKNTTTSPDDAL